MNLPNILTLLRMLMVPAVIVCFAANHPLWSLFFFLLASATDVLDGYLARKFNQITNFGKVMDPLADKLMLITTLICLYLTGRIPMWVPIVIGVKSMHDDHRRGLPLPQGHRPPLNFFGKLATVLFTVAVLMSLLLRYGRSLATVLLYIATGVALFAMVYYGVIVLRSNPQLFKRK